MGDKIEPVLLRPLSIGEIFDRSVALLVRNWVPFAIISALAVVPREAATYLSVAVNPGWAILGLPLTLLLSVATVANAIVVAQIYRSEQVNWRYAFVYGLGRIPGIIAVAFLVFLAAIVPLLVLVGVPAELGVFRFPNAGADIIAVFAGLVGGAVFLGFSFASNYAVAAMGIDELHAPDSVIRALSLFQPPMLGRTLLFALAQQLTVIGAEVVGQAVLTALTMAHQLALGTAVEAAILFVVTPFGSVLISVFYFDVAMRREGYDMQVALEGLSSG